MTAWRATLTGKIIETALQPFYTVKDVVRGYLLIFVPKFTDASLNLFQLNGIAMLSAALCASSVLSDVCFTLKPPSSLASLYIKRLCWYTSTTIRDHCPRNFHSSIDIFSFCVRQCCEIHDDLVAWLRLQSFSLVVKSIFLAGQIAGKDRIALENSIAAYKSWQRQIWHRNLPSIPLEYDLW